MQHKVWVAFMVQRTSRWTPTPRGVSSRGWYCKQKQGYSSHLSHGWSAFLRNKFAPRRQTLTNRKSKNILICSGSRNSQTCCYHCQHSSSYFFFKSKTPPLPPTHTTTTTYPPVLCASETLILFKTHHKDGLKPALRTCQWTQSKTKKVVV